MITLLVIHAGVTWCLVGLIWVIQVVHYPMFKNVGRENFVAYHERHMALILWLVAPLMFVEIGSAVVIFWMGERSMPFCISLGALFMVWVATALLQVPLHNKLTLGYDEITIDRLVSTNIWRTLAWTLRGVCLSSMLISQFNK
jgi:hypothetical protein